ncbi:hypothetical protein ACMAUO_20710 [Gluconacetobacter sp. Hr-1-5]|uniref:hypothetical protein n=1 Tax=Gluconacetobacter sp. Hr-1-5 TaxID=3395370 RepID=UPI003B521BFA
MASITLFPPVSHEISERIARKARCANLSRYLSAGVWLILLRLRFPLAGTTIVSATCFCTGRSLLSRTVTTRPGIVHFTFGFIGAPLLTLAVLPVGLFAHSLTMIG